VRPLFLRLVATGICVAMPTKAMDASVASNGTIVTGVSSSHLTKLKSMLGSAQRVLPDTWRVSVYDLVDDLAPADLQLLNSYCGVTVKPFPGTMDFRYLASSAWKVHIIEAELDLLMPQDFVLYVDAGMQFARQWIPSTIFVAAREQGVVGIKTAGPVAMYTHPSTFAELASIAPTLGVTTVSDYQCTSMICG